MFTGVLNLEVALWCSRRGLVSAPNLRRESVLPLTTSSLKSTIYANHATTETILKIVGATAARA
jgi:hypothetical protein